MEYAIGMFARSLAGHDKNKLYLIIQAEDEYVYLVDGKIRTLDRPKKKKRKHIQIDYQVLEFVKQKIESGQMLRDEDIKRAIKQKECKCESY